MLLITHIKLTKLIASGKIEGKQLNLLLLGSMLPDLNCILKPHRYSNLQGNLRRHQHTYQRSDISDVRRYHTLGMLLHYYCDCFCRAHNDSDILTGTKHTKYELYLEKAVSSLMYDSTKQCNKEFCLDFDKEYKSYIKQKRDVKTDILYSIEFGKKIIEKYLRDK